MGAVSGDIVEISFSNDVVGSATLYIKSGETVNFDTGGLRNEVSVDGSGQPIIKKNRVPWMFEGPISWDMNTREDMEKLVASAEALTESTWEFTHINGSVYSGTGVPDGDLSGDVNEGTIPLTVKGGGKLVKQ